MLFILLFLASINLISSADLNQTDCKCPFINYLKYVQEHVHIDKKVSPRMLNSREVDYEDFRFTGVLFLKTKDKKIIEEADQPVTTNYSGYIYDPFCTGVILNKMWFMTVAHCLNRYDFKLNPWRYTSYVAAGGSHEMRESFFNEKFYRAVEKYIMHPEYLASVRLGQDKGAFFPREFDIGLVKVKKPFEFGQRTNIYPACLDFTYHKRFKDSFIVAGFGNIDAVKSDRGILHAGNLILADNTKLRATTMEIFEEPCHEESDYCVQKADLGQPCFGDNGAPIMYYRGSNALLVGLIVDAIGGVGFDKSRDCLLLKDYAILMIYNLIPWIKSEIGDSNLCQIGT